MFNKIHTHRIRYYVLFGILILLASCINNPTGDQTTRPKHFDLIAPNVQKNFISNNNQVVIMKPTVKQALSGKKIAVVTNSNQISYFKDWYWSDDLSSLVQAKIVEVFDKDGYFQGVGMPNQGVSTDFRIVTEIQAFQFEERDEGIRTRDCWTPIAISRPIISDEDAVLSSNMQGELDVNEIVEESKLEYWSVVKISVKVIYERKGKVLAKKSYCTETNVEFKKVEMAVEGMNFVLGEVLEKIVEFTVNAVEGRPNDLEK